MLHIHFRGFLPHYGILPRAKFTFHPPSLVLSYFGSITAWHSSSGRQPNFAALNTGRHVYSARRPPRWALAHILVFSVLILWVRQEGGHKKSHKAHFNYLKVSLLGTRSNMKILQKDNQLTKTDSTNSSSSSIHSNYVHVLYHLWNNSTCSWNMAKVTAIFDHCN